MIGVVANFTAKPGSADALATIMGELASAVRANEPGNKLYEVMRSREDPDSFVVLELYESQEAFGQHQRGAHLAEIPARMGPFLAAKPLLQLLDGLD